MPLLSFFDKIHTNLKVKCLVHIFPIFFQSPDAKNVKKAERIQVLLRLIAISSQSITNNLIC